MDRKDELTLIREIVERAERMGIGHGDRLTMVMDIDFANKQFNLRLADFLNADNMNFAHDFCGIQSHMNRLTCKCEDFFLPRFATT